MKSFIVVIPARFASTRLPGKPLLDLGGKPMVVLVAETARASGAARVVVATDDARIEDACRSHGVESLSTRKDHATGTDRIAEVAVRLDLAPNQIVVNVQGDEPFLPPSAIDRVARLLEDDSKAAMATLCHPLSDGRDVTNPHVVKVVLDGNGRALYFSRAPIPYARDAWSAGMGSEMPLPPGLPIFRHVGLYAYRAHFLRAFPLLEHPQIERFEALEQLRALWHGYPIAVGVIEAPLPPGIDTAEDYAAALRRLAGR